MGQISPVDFFYHRKTVALKNVYKRKDGTEWVRETTHIVLADSDKLEKNDDVRLEFWDARSLKVPFETNFSRLNDLNNFNMNIKDLQKRQAQYFASPVLKTSLRDYGKIGQALINANDLFFHTVKTEIGTYENIGIDYLLDLYKQAYGGWHGVNSIGPQSLNASSINKEVLFSQKISSNAKQTIKTLDGKSKRIIDFQHSSINKDKIQASLSTLINGLTNVSNELKKMSSANNQYVIANMETIQKTADQLSNELASNDNSIDYKIKTTDLYNKIKGLLYIAQGDLLESAFGKVSTNLSQSNQDEIIHVALGKIYKNGKQLSIDDYIMDTNQFKNIENMKLPAPITLSLKDLTVNSEGNVSVNNTQQIIANTYGELIQGFQKSNYQCRVSFQIDNKLVTERDYDKIFETLRTVGATIQAKSGIGQTAWNKTTTQIKGPQILKLFYDIDGFENFISHLELFYNLFNVTHQRQDNYFPYLQYRTHEIYDILYAYGISKYLPYIIESNLKTDIMLSAFGYLPMSQYIRAQLEGKLNIEYSTGMSHPIGIPSGFLRPVLRVDLSAPGKIIPLELSRSTTSIAR